MRIFDPKTTVPDAVSLLRWYDRHRRSMPWRARPGEIPDPYRVWLSEIMLQQTTVAAVVPYFSRFMDRFPTVEALAAADTSRVMEAWAGLGYYARARNLHACAKAVVTAGGFPRDMAGLQMLPGVGVYTAAAISSIAFGIPVVPVDGNVERVAARVYAIDQPLPGGKRAIAEAAARLGNDPAARARPSDFTQALFDLGATICTPRRPACALCPWIHACAAQAGGHPESLPVKPPRKARPQRFGAHFCLEDAGGHILFKRRPPSGLFGGMLELPGVEWRDAPWSRTDALTGAPQSASWRHVGTVRHGLTHFELTLEVYAAAVANITAEGLRVSADDMASAALPSVMRKCVRLIIFGKKPALLTVD